MVHTKQRPVEGGGKSASYVWTQTSTDITMTFKVSSLFVSISYLQEQNISHSSMNSLKLELTP